MRQKFPDVNKLKKRDKYNAVEVQKTINTLKGKTTKKAKKEYNK